MSWSDVKSVNNCWKIKLHQKSDSRLMFVCWWFFFLISFMCVCPHVSMSTVSQWFLEICHLSVCVFIKKKTVSLFILCSWRDFKTTATAYGNLFLFFCCCYCCQPDFFSPTPANFVTAAIASFFLSLLCALWVAILILSFGMNDGLHFCNNVRLSVVSSPCVNITKRFANAKHIRTYKHTQRRWRRRKITTNNRP